MTVGILNDKSDIYLEVQRKGMKPLHKQQQQPNKSLNYHISMASCVSHFILIYEHF